MYEGFRMFYNELKKICSTSEFCKKCPLNGHQKVFYDFLKNNSNYNSCDIMFFGINPGKQEAKQGKPFIGPSGQLLRKKIQETHLDTFNICFTNAILCSTPNEKDIPDVTTCIECCKPNVRKIVQYFKPKIMIPVGRNCANFLFNINGKISQISGHVFGENKNIIPIIHPASAIYNRIGKNINILTDSLNNIYRVLASV